MRVFLTHNVEDRSAYFGRALPELEAIAEVVVNPLDRDLTDDELLEFAAGCQVIVAHRSTPGSARLFAEHDNIVAFLRCAVDISTIDVGAASAAGVVVARADKSFVPSTAELALGLLLDLWRNIASSDHDYRQGHEPPQRPGRQLRGATAGIIGLGAIGAYLAELLVGVGMHVLGHDVDDVEVAGVETTSMDDLLARSDVVFPLAPALPSTENLIDATALAKMKPGASLVNVSRGELVDEDAVAAALDAGTLAGFACDVGWAPDQRPSAGLASRPNVVATPHLGGLTPENADAQARSAVEQLAAMLAGDVPPRSVNEASADRLRAWWQAQ
jgi:D-3-phosphoglycerate dehydrogenase